MSEKEEIKRTEQEAKQQPSHPKEVKRYIGDKKKKVSEKQTESQTGPHTPHGKKQRRQSKLYPNRG
jgi:hypothetical protein